jgi:hypothetical protein
MPEISRFFGIVIKMFFDDHNNLQQDVSVRSSGQRPSGVRPAKQDARQLRLDFKGAGGLGGFNPG